MNEMELERRLDVKEEFGYDQSYLQGFADGWREQHHKIDGMERREVTFRSEIEHRENFIRRLMAELRRHGWGDERYMMYPEQDRNIASLLEEGEIYEQQFVIMQEGNVYERGSDQSGAPSEEAGTQERTTTGEIPLC